MFGYRPAMEVNFFIKILLYLGYLLEQPEKKHGDVINFFPIVVNVFENKGNIWIFFFLKKGIFNRIYVLAKWRQFTTKKKQKTLI